MKSFKDKLYHHEIKPSPKAWERIEAQMDKGKVRHMPINLRWAAAAMFIFAATGVITWRVMENPANQDFVQTGTPKSTNETITNSTPTITKNEIVITNSISDKTTITISKDNNFKENNKESSDKTTAMPFEQKSNFVAQTIITTPTVTPKVFEKRAAENIASLDNKRDWKYFETKTQNIDIRKIRTEDDDYYDEEETTITLGNLKIPRLINSETDSTLTERVLAIGEQRAKQAVSRAFKPVLKRFKK